MTTLYIRDVPDDVAETLKQRAAAQGQSLSAYVAAELKQIASRPTNAEIIDRLRIMDRTSGPGREEILAEIAANRR